jgi:flagellar biosynthesis GTPase FlhF
MIIKKYVVNTVDEVQELISRDLGPNAVILTSRHIQHKGLKALFFSNKVEVVAAVDEQDLQTFEQMKAQQKQQQPLGAQEAKSEKIESETSKEEQVPILAQSKSGGSSSSFFQKKEKRSNNVPHEWESSFRDTLDEDEEKKITKEFENLEEPPDYEASTIPGTYLDPRFNRKAALDVREITAEVQQTKEEKELRTRPLKQNVGTLAQQYSNADKSISKTPQPSRSRSSRQQPPLESATFLEDIYKLKADLINDFGTLIVEKETTEKMIQEDSKVLGTDEEAMNALIHKEMDSKQAETRPYPQIKGIAAFLKCAGISSKLAKELEQKLRGQFDAIDMSSESQDKLECLQVLMKELSARIPVSGPICLTKGKRTFAALVGPAGCGKTTAAIQIAKQYKEELGKKVGILSLGTQRGGSKEQIVALTEELKLSLQFAENAVELSQALENNKDLDLVLIDCIGCSPCDFDQISIYANLFQQIEEAHLHLVIHASLKEDDALFAIRQFEKLKCESLIFTKLDETGTKGSILTICQLTGLPISYFAIGPQILRGLFIADPDHLAKLILKDAE